MRGNPRSFQVMQVHRQFLFYNNSLQIEDGEAKLAPLRFSRRDASTDMQHDIPGSCDRDLRSNFNLTLQGLHAHVSNRFDARNTILPTLLFYHDY